jgi:hypothetical protein
MQLVKFVFPFQMHEETRRLFVCFVINRCESMSVCHVCSNHCLGKIAYDIIIVKLDNGLRVCLVFLLLHVASQLQLCAILRRAVHSCICVNLI